MNINIRSTFKTAYLVTISFTIFTIQNITYGQTPHAVYGILQYSDGSHPASAYWTAYIAARPSTTINQSSPGSSYDNSSGGFLIQLGGCLPWSAGETLHVDFNDGYGSTISSEIILTNNSSDNMGTITLNSPDIDVSPTSKNYGNVVIGSNSNQTFIVRNTGNQTLNITSTSITGTDASEFSIISGSGAFTLSPGSTHDVVIQFSPTSTGSKSATFRITSNDPDENPLDVPLSGTGMTVPDISIDPTSRDFGDVNVGSSASQTFTISNDGNGDLQVSSTNLTGSNAGEFSITSGGGSFTLAPAATREIVVEFNPSNNGVKNAILRIASNDPDENPLDVALSGNGLAPDIDVDPDSKNFGIVNKGQSKSQKFVVTNTGNSALNVTSTIITGTDSDQFSIDNGVNSFILTPSSSQDVVVSFRPTSSGSKKATLKFISNDPDENPKNIALSGSSGAPEIDIRPDNYDFGNVFVDSTESFTFLVRNHGDAILNITETKLTGKDKDEFKIKRGGGSYTIYPGMTHMLVVNFTPNSTGQKEAVIVIHNNDPDENPRYLNLTGVGVLGDIESPELKRCYPPADGVGVPRNTNVRFEIFDNNTGIDKNSICLSVNGIEIINCGKVLDSYNVIIKSKAMKYIVKYDPDSSFNSEENVTINVKGTDLSIHPNSLDTTYIFTVGASNVHITTTDSIGPDGGIITDDSTGITMIIPAGALEDTTDISIGVTDSISGISDTIDVFGSIYHFWPDGLRFLIPITVRITYTQDDLNSAGVLDPESLPIYYLSTSTGELSLLSVIGSDDHFIYVEVSEFCYLTFGKVTHVGDVTEKIGYPETFELVQNYPNPFNSLTTICYSIQKSSHVKIEIFDMKGKRIRTLVDDEKEPGEYRTTWDGFDERGKCVSSGQYIVIMKSNGRVKMRKALFMK